MYKIQNNIAAGILRFWLLAPYDTEKIDNESNYLAICSTDRILSKLGLCRVSRVVGYPTIASSTRTQISVRVREMLHCGKMETDVFFSFNW